MSAATVQGNQALSSRAREYARPTALGRGSAPRGATRGCRAAKLLVTTLQLCGLLFEQAPNAMFGEVHPPHADAERARHLLRRPLFEAIQIENLKLFGIDQAFDPFQRGSQQVLFPFLVPDRFEIEPGRVGDLFPT